MSSSKLPTKEGDPTKGKYYFDKIVLSEEELKAAESAPLHVTHLILVVHGVGYKGPEELSEHMKEMQKSCKEIMKERFGPEIGAHITLEFRTFDWRNEVRKEFNHVSTVLNSCTLPTLDVVRSNINTGSIGAMLMLSQHQFTIARAVARLLNDEYMQFCSQTHTRLIQNNRLFVSILGHSFGAVTAYNILSNPQAHRLDFPVHALITTGSPLAMFLSAQGRLPGQHSRVFPNQDPPPCNYFYNIFHPCDPLVYRVEPLFLPKSTNVKREPVKIPNWRTLGKLELKGIVGSVFSSKRKGKGSGSSPAGAVFTMPGSPSSTHSGGLKSGNSSFDTTDAIDISSRYDYALQLELDEKPMNEMTLLNSHNRYFECRDTMFFIVTQSIRSLLLVPLAPESPFSAPTSKSLSSGEGKQPAPLPPSVPEPSPNPRASGGYASTARSPTGPAASVAVSDGSRPRAGRPTVTVPSASSRSTATTTSTSHAASSSSFTGAPPPPLPSLPARPLTPKTAPAPSNATYF